MWQSMNIPGTPLDTHESTGAPVGAGQDGGDYVAGWLTHGDVRHKVTADRSAAGRSRDARLRTHP